MGLTMQEFLRSYFSERDLRDSTRVFFRCKVAVFERWLGRAATLADLNSTTVNAFLDYRISDRSRETARSERAVLHALWQAAFDARLLEHPPLRLKKIRRAVPEVEAWDCGQIDGLLKAAVTQRGCFRVNRVPKSLYWLAVVRTLFDTGLRTGDLLHLEAPKFVGPGSYQIVQRKTAKPVFVEISPETWQAMQAIKAPARKLIFGDVVCRRAFFEGFAVVCKAAGLDGRTKMLRRASGSLVEAEFPGEGHNHLGNGRSVFERHYLARRLAPVQARRPTWRPSEN
jgi:site-specific recombinase XerD